MFHFKSIKGRIVLLFAAQSVIISIFFLLLSQFYSMKISIKNLDYNSTALVNSFEQTINNWIKERKRDITNLSMLPAIKKMDWNSIEPYLQELIAKDNYRYFMYFLADKNGDYHTTMQRNAGNISNREYFVRVMNGETIISDPLISKSTGRQISVVATPVFDEKKNIVGLFAANIELKELNIWMKEFLISNDNSYSYIVDNSGLVITHPDESLIMNFNLFDYLKSIHGDTNLVYKNEGNIQYKFKNIDAYAYFKTIEGTPNWKIVTKISKKYLNKPVYNMILVLLITMTLCLFLSVFLAFLFARSISNPIIKLRNVFQHGLLGDIIDVRVEFKSNDEIGEVALCFNQLMEKNKILVNRIAEKGNELKEYIDHLTTFNAKISSEGNILIANQTMITKLAIESRNILAKKIWDIEWFSSNVNSIERIRENLLKTNTSDIIYGEETILKGEYGYFSIEYSLRPVKNEKGSILFIIFEARDITDRIIMENELLNIKKLESIGVLAGGIAHDFNNILTGVLGMISLAKCYAKEGDEIYDKLSSAEKSTLKAKDLTQQLLTFSKGGFPLKKTTPIKQVLTDSVEFGLSGSTIKWDIYIAPDILAVDIDEGQIYQVFSNIVINARQAMPVGGYLSVTAENFNNSEKTNPLLDKKKYIRITFTDTGDGIPDEIKKKIFDPYFSTKKEGSGLGLATSYSIIKKHDGYITIDSQIGHGASFILYLPVSNNISIEDLSVQQPEKTAIKNKPINNMMTSKGKILVMDDDDIVIKVAKGIISYYGYEVDAVFNGMEAVNEIKLAHNSGNKFDLIILDLTVPGGAGGREVIDSIKNIEPDIKAIVSSGYSNDPVVSEFKKYNFDGVVSKPYVADQLMSVINELLKK